MKLLPRLLAAGLFAVALLPSADAEACSPKALTEFQVDPLVSDETPPGAASAMVTGVERGSWWGAESLCSHLGSIRIRFDSHAGDDPLAIGYRLELAAGELPSRMDLPPWPIALSRDGSISLHWSDGICEEQEPIAFALRVIPVDRAGNEGPPFKLRVTAPGRSPGVGCGPMPGLPSHVYKWPY